MIVLRAALLPLVLLMAAALPGHARQKAVNASLPLGNTFLLVGLSSPATVAESIFVSAPGLPVTAQVVYLLDEKPIATTSQPPFAMGGPDGFSLSLLVPGVHKLRAVATLADGGTLASNIVALRVVASINARLSADLTVYPNEPSAQANSVEALLRKTSTLTAALTLEEIATRTKVLAMYQNWGIDPSLDSDNDRSEMLLALAPRSWSAVPSVPAGAPLSLAFSPDAPFYQPIPEEWPRVPLPSGYIRRLQLNTNKQGDGIGFGETVAAPHDPWLPIRSQWYSQTSTLKTFSFAMSLDWFRQLPEQLAGDRHMIFVDPGTNAFVSSYKTSRDSTTGGVEALYASTPTSLATLGDRGGSIAAGFAELPAMLQPGEATNPTRTIRHALGGAVGRVWATRVFPASAWDAAIKRSINTCTGTNFTNTGLVPYGGVIQLDPKLDLGRLKLTLPARRILEAMQTYGYYVMDFGCADLDIYTAIPESELDPFGGLWGYNRKGPGVQNEVEAVLLKNTLYVVVPLTKKQ